MQIVLTRAERIQRDRIVMIKVKKKYESRIKNLRLAADQRIERIFFGLKFYLTFLINFCFSSCLISVDV